MIANRELGLDDYLAMARRRWKLVLILAVLLLPVGFLTSFAFSPKYNSQSLVLVEDQLVPQGYVKPVVTEDVVPRIVTLQQRVLSRSRLRALVERLGLARKGVSPDDAIENIRQNISVTPLQPGVSPAGSSSSSSSSPASTLASAQAKRKPPQSASTATVPGFTVSFVADNPRDAQQICAEITSMILAENLVAREQLAQSTTEFISRQLEEAKHTLEDMDGRLATFKKQHLGQLPGDLDSNLKILAGLNSQLDANTQTLNRAQQDKSFAESLLTQQLATWKSSQGAENLQTLQQQVQVLQNQLITLRSRYTDDHPDVIKINDDIAELKSRIKQGDSASSGAVEKTESQSPGIEQLRLQIHQYDAVIAQATQEQKRLQQQIDAYQGRLALSPEVEQQYAALTRNNETAQKIYNNLATNKSDAEMQVEMERRQEGEQMRVLGPASLPDSPSFPNRLLFAGGGLAAGLGLGLAIAFWQEVRDKSMRDEADVLAGLELPMLVSVPWVGEEETQNGLRPLLKRRGAVA